MRVRIYLLFLVLLLLPGVLYGQAKVATAGAQFLEIGVSARAVGMGEAFIAVADDATAIYQTTWGAQAAIWNISGLYKCRFEKEAPVKDKINSLRASTLTDMWMDGDGLIRGAMQVPPLPDYEPDTITNDNIVHGSREVSRNEPDRITRTTVYYNSTVVDPPVSGEDVTANYDGYAYIDADGEGTNFYNEIRKDNIYSPWIYQIADAKWLSARRFLKYQYGAPQTQFDIELKDEPEVGDYLTCTFTELPNEDGSSKSGFCYVISVAPSTGNVVTILVEDAGFAQHKFGLIGYINPVLDEDLTDSEDAIDVDLAATDWTFDDMEVEGGVFRCLPDGEKIAWTGITDMGGDVVRFTGCSRGEDGTAAVVHSAGDQIMMLFYGAHHHIHTLNVWIGDSTDNLLDSDGDYTDDADGYRIY